MIGPVGIIGTLEYLPELIRLSNHNIVVCLAAFHFLDLILENLSFQSSDHNHRVLQWLSQLKFGIKSIKLSFTKVYVFQEGHKSLTKYSSFFEVYQIYFLQLKFSSYYFVLPTLNIILLNTVCLILLYSNFPKLLF